jgi:hypothetical protein
MWEQWDREESNLALPGFDRPRRQQRFSPLVGLAGLEPAISCTQSRRDAASLQPVEVCPPPESNRDAPKGTAF